jgi:hypothetical protein
MYDRSSGSMITVTLAAAAVAALSLPLAIGGSDDHRGANTGMLVRLEQAVIRAG